MTRVAVPLTALAAALTVVLCLISFTQAFAQTSNATLGGTVSDASGADPESL
jgi:hypothetical protein